MSSDGSEGIGVVGLAWLVLIVLKALGHLTWGWMAIVFFPVWFTIGVALIFCSIGLIGLLFLILVCAILTLCGIR